MSNQARIQQCIDKHDEYVLTLAAMPDSRLAEKLETIHLQIALALQQGNMAAVDLLEVWRAQTIEAHTYKAEHNIPDAFNEIEESIAQIETFTAETDKSAEVLTEYAAASTNRRQTPAPPPTASSFLFFK